MSRGLVDRSLPEMRESGEGGGINRSRRVPRDKSRRDGQFAVEWPGSEGGERDSRQQGLRGRRKGGRGRTRPQGHMRTAYRGAGPLSPAFSGFESPC